MLTVTTEKKTIKSIQLISHREKLITQNREINE